MLTLPVRLQNDCSHSAHRYSHIDVYSHSAHRYSHIDVCSHSAHRYSHIDVCSSLEQELDTYGVLLLTCNKQGRAAIWELHTGEAEEKS
eukprot:38134-Pelagomonas_calceolata.AAC.7